MGVEAPDSKKRKPEEKEKQNAAPVKFAKIGSTVKGVGFITRRQRDKNQVMDEKKQRSEDQKKMDDLHRRRKEFLMQEELERERQRQRERDEREKERKRREEDRIKEREQKEKMKDQTRVANGSSLAEFNMLKLTEDDPRKGREVDKELENIKKHYLGVRDVKRKMQKPSEKFRNIFNFEWAPEDDTQRNDTNPLYTKRAEPQLLFGRGYRAGIDVREQRKQNNFYEELISRRAEANGEEVANFIAKDSTSFKIRDIEFGDEHKIHWSEKPVKDMTERDWKIFREDFEIYIKGGRVPAPMRTWTEGPLSWELFEAVTKVGYTKPTAIQMQTIPIGCQYRDLIGVAQTGSGKTAAYLLPMLMYMKDLPQLNFDTAPDGPYAIVLAPSRELIQQIDTEFKKFSHFCSHIRSVCCIGGNNAEDQAFALRKGLELILATPGRLVDALDKQYTVLHQCNYVVLDEADKMVDFGFEEFVVQVLNAIPSTNLKSENEDEVLRQELEAKAGHRKYRITHMFSATMPPAVERLARKYLRCPAYISIGDPGVGKKNIEQRLEFISPAQKKTRLEILLRQTAPPIIVFVNQRKAAEVLCKSLDNQNFKVTTLHGGKQQEQREWALQSFREGRYDILIATEVAGRGLDVEDVQMVINFDMAKSIEDYTHRIGRTGRVDKKGVATTFLTQDDSETFYDLKNFLTQSKQPVPHELASHPAARFKPGTITENGYEAGRRQNVLYTN